ncbi:uncharacterized protein LOC130648906 [Hydractinia symbiolongicarpus]|uniref:uncharacterized protein LOC130648906 n=1 Tax=Hydractinia symbiolongicarpus TaxID=13093 RepID=UPI00254D9E1D|nr:uncharacterized protein LOC130648906 [Hydractinia symbiolongicarpus]
MKTSPAKIILIIGSIIALIFLSSSCGGNAWIKSPKSTLGLWKGCVEINSQNVCLKLPNSVVEKYGLGLLRGLLIVAVLASICAVAMSVLTLFTGRFAGFAAAIFLIVAGVTSVSAVIIFIETRKLFLIGGLDLNELIPFSWSYIMGWIGAIVCFLSTLCGFYISCIEQQD